MALLIESGIFYCISLVSNPSEVVALSFMSHSYLQITVLVATLVRLPVGTLGDLYTPVNVQLAGIYPIVVLILINHERSLDRTIFINSIAMHVSGLDRSTGPAIGGVVSTVLFQSNPSGAAQSQSSQTQSATSMVTDVDPALHTTTSSGYESPTHPSKAMSSVEKLAEPFLGLVANEVVETKSESLV